MRYREEKGEIRRREESNGKGKEIRKAARRDEMRENKRRGEKWREG